jgi:acyl-CoA thioesterase I
MRAGIICLTLVCLFLSRPMHAQSTIRYVALGDSYTIGTGASPQESWPRLLTDRLKARGLAIELAGNLGRNGWTARDVINVELGELKQLNGDFATLLIGTNDWVQGVPAAIFQAQFVAILDNLKALIERGRLVVLTIPDFSVTPDGKVYSDGRNIRQGIAEFNAIIDAECRKRGIPTVDLFSLAKEFEADPSLISADRLHPRPKVTRGGRSSWSRKFINI